MGGLALMDISPKIWEFLTLFMSTLGIIQPHLKSFSDLSEPIGRSESEYAKSMIKKSLHSLSNQIQNFLNFELKFFKMSYLIN